ncbi:MAG: dihydrodipicolinate synthase family protein [Actinomyces urogenitalis]|uniref:dihydrodipicolinate synthase family protein n=1 Tax=Actinomyces urogenitalis TaxID=103621 RepID=UPI002A82FEC8|nr:dihydrodipicolinate synthase family protein [Actinomyces urogenitalis]MDY3678909.1 dihydrodipicolinate synthase family protein [Actinomyces urogenitalis]
MPAWRHRARCVSEPLFAGLSAFPLTPMREDGVDEEAFVGIVKRLAAAGVDSIGALGSTGSYAYLSRAERARVARLAVEHAAGVPVIVGVGALRTSQVLALVDDAEAAGAAGLLLPAMSYQPLTDDDVLGLFRAVTEHTGLPVIVYDNPGTTHTTLSLDLYARLAQLPGIVSFKIPGVPCDPAGARQRVAQIRSVLPGHVTVGVSGDSCAAAGLNAGCETWYSVVGGMLPKVALAIVRAAQAGRGDDAQALADRLAPLWELFEDHGSLRVVAAVAERLGFAPDGCLPLPLRGLTADERERVAAVVARLGLAG